MSEAELDEWEIRVEGERWYPDAMPFGLVVVHPRRDEDDKKHGRHWWITANLGIIVEGAGGYRTMEEANREAVRMVASLRAERDALGAKVALYERCIVAAYDAVIENDIMEVSHQLYTAASQDFTVLGCDPFEVLRTTLSAHTPPDGGKEEK